VSLALFRDAFVGISISIEDDHLRNNNASDADEGHEEVDDTCDAKPDETSAVVLPHCTDGRLKAIRDERLGIERGSLVSLDIRIVLFLMLGL